MLRQVGIVTSIVCFALVARLSAEEPKDAEIKELKAKVQQLENRVKELEEFLRPMMKQAGKGRPTALRQKFDERMRRDKKTYSQKDLQEIEGLYQVANKQWKSPEAREALEKLIQKYSKANRTGCAVLYLGQMSDGEEKEKYLKKAIEEFSDCWYGNGVQVGAMARFLLAGYYQQTGQEEEAARLYGEIREQYPNAVTHDGKSLIDAIPQ